MRDAPRVDLAESRGQEVDVGVPGAEVAAVDGIDGVVGLAAAEADAVLAGGRGDARFQAEGVVVVDPEAALEDDAGVAKAASLAGVGALPHPSLVAQADAPVGIEGELEA